MKPATISKPGKPKLRWIVLPAKGLAGTLIALVILELVLQVIGLFLPSENSRDPAGSDGAVNILCVGDSHTYGLDVAAPFNYPNRLHVLLNAGMKRDRYCVINRSVPGRNSAEVREKLPGYLDRFRPAVVLFLCGYNDSWNSYGSWYWEGEEKEGSFHMKSLLSHIKLFRLAKLVLLSLDAAPDRDSDDFRITADGDQLIVVENGEEKYVNPGAGSTAGLRTGQDLERVAGMDLEACVKICREQKAVPVLLTYALTGGHFDPVNTAARDVAKKTGAMLIDQAKAFVSCLETEDREKLFFEHLHLKPRGYEIASAEISRALVKAGLVDEPPGVGKTNGRSGTGTDISALNLGIAVKSTDKDGRETPVLIVSGAKDVTFQLMFSLNDYSEGNIAPSGFEEVLGIAMDELAGLSIGIPSFSGSFGDDPVRIEIPPLVLDRYAGRRVFCILAALDPHAGDPYKSLLGATKPVALVFPSR